MKEPKFFICKHCGNMVGMLKDSGVKMICCGDPMTELTANTVEASAEKHIPKVIVDGDIVSVQIGSVEHPMIEEHHIEWVYLHTDKGGQRKELVVGEKPAVQFALKDEKLISVYEYCNIHGLWKLEM